MNNKTTKVAAMLTLALAFQSVGRAETVGYNTVSEPANSDIYVTVPFSQDVAASYTVSSVAPGVGVNVAGPLTTNQYQTVFYVRFTSGSAAGQWATVSSNSATQIVLSATGFLGSVTAGDTFNVIRHQTLDSIFPDGYESLSYKASTSVATRLTEVLIPSTAVGINKSASDTYYYRVVSGVGDWRRVGSSPTASFNDVVIPPQSYFIIRNNTASALTFYALGDVTTTTFTDRVSVETAQNDIAKGGFNAIDTTFKKLNLGGTAAFVTSTNATGNRDQLFLYNNALTGINKSAAATYYYFNNAWRKIGDSPVNSHDNDVIPAGAALQIRKFSGASSTTVDWTQNPSF